MLFFKALMYTIRKKAAARPAVEDETKPFLDHLEDLRNMIVKMAVTIALTMTVGFIFRQELMRFCQWPLRAVNEEWAKSLQSLGVADSFTLSFTLAFHAGLVIAFPFLLYFFAQFVLPALTEREKKYVYPAVGVGFALFLTGVTLAFSWILPITLKFLAQDAQELGLRPSWTVREYFAFVTQFVIGFGLAFELPVVVLTLVKLGVLSYEMLATTRRYAVVLIVTLAAVISPTTDLLSLVLLSAPLLILYESCIWIARYMEKREKKREALEAELRLKEDMARREAQLAAQPQAALPPAPTQPTLTPPSSPPPNHGEEFHP
ncbi:MAG: twin-arginine translocase subunit TatC [Verrucomicrobia bacterium]|nr:twin-arginine translocase subunit TatC [Verrucomicrobiota bacterium]